MNIKLGQKVIDKTTGFKGVVEHIVYPLHDAVKIGIQAPVGKDGKMGECYVVDYIGVEVVDEKPVVKAIPSEPKYPLGAKAECTITGFKGTITAYALYLNGCVRYKIQPVLPAGKKAEDYAAQYLPEGSLKVTNLPKKEKEPTKTGGPKEKILRGKSW